MSMLSMKTVTGRKAIYQILDEVQYKCTARTISISDMENMLMHVEKKLDITKVALNGTRVKVACYVHKNAGVYRTNSKYSYPSTIFEALYKNGVWYITSIYRDEPRLGGNRVVCELSDSAKNAIAKKYERFV